MMNKKLNNGIFYVVISFVAVLAIGSVMAVAYNGYGTPKVIVEGNYIEAQPVETTQVVQTETSGDVSIVDENGVDLGAMPGPVITSPCLTINGVNTCYKSLGLARGTSTPCAIKSPSATSTLMVGSISFTTATTIASFIEIGRATNPTATTTKIGDSFTIAANGTATMIASSSGSSVANEAATKFPPNTYFVVKMGLGTGLTANPVGKCQAVFVETK